MSRLTTLFLILFAGLALVHSLALEWRLYWHFEWFDIVMHLWGGVILGFGWMVLADLRLLPTWIARSTLLATLAILATVVLWELFEVFIVNIPIEPDFWHDTSLDVVLGLLGGLLSHTFARRMRQ